MTLIPSFVSTNSKTFFQSSIFNSCVIKPLKLTWPVFNRFRHFSHASQVWLKVPLRVMEATFLITYLN